jgi:hypothetical protein
MFNTQILAGSSGQGGETQQSLKFNDDESQYLSWTPAAAGNRKTWTWSAWVKQGNINTSANQTLFSASGGSAEDMIRFVGSAGGSDHNKINFYIYDGGYIAGGFTTSQVFRDPSAWYHIVWVWDSSNATSTDRIRLYVNGERITAFDASSYPSLNADCGGINNSYQHEIGRQTNATTRLFDGYLSDVYFIDGQALDASSFGQFTNGYWEAKDYAGSYGTNGFHLTFKDDVVSEGFNATTYLATEANQSISGIGFSPDLVIVKNRDSSANARWGVIDSVRGVNKTLATDITDAEVTSRSDLLTSFDADGFSLGADAAAYGWNNQTYTAGDRQVAWCWDAGSGSAASNTDGSITSTVKANPSYGFSITSYVGTGVDGDTVGHGLTASAPELVIIKGRTGSGYPWAVYGYPNNPAFPNDGSVLYLNDTAAMTDSTGSELSLGASTITFVDSGANINGSGQDYICYAFHSVAGYSSIGSYTGNGSSTGPTVTTGFPVAFVMIKRTDGVGGWYLQDNTRTPTNPANKFLDASDSDAEATGAAVDLTSTGFQLANPDAGTNASGGTYIYMAFADTREAAFWKDVSGQGNHWTPSGLDYRDSLIDSPANNFNTTNVLSKGSYVTHSNGNLTVTGNTSSNNGNYLAFPRLTSGKYYYEQYINIVSLYPYFIFNVSSDTFYFSNGGTGWPAASNVRISGASAGGYTGLGASTGDIIGIAVDLDSGTRTVKIYKNNSLLETINITTPDAGIGMAEYNGSFSVYNFGQDSTFSGNRPAGGNQDDNGIGDFAYAPPSGYLALCTANLPTPTIVDGSEHFNTVLWSAQSPYGDISISGVNFQPDFVWVKSRPQAYNHTLFDSVRGVAKTLYSDSTSAETANSIYGYLSSFDADGFTGSAGSSDNSYFNYTGNSYVAWNWKAGGTAVSNTDGTITSQVSANVDAGFSIVSYTGNGTAGATVGHGLSSAPDMIIVKPRVNTTGWVVGHSSLNSGTNPWQWYLSLEGTAAQGTTNLVWNNTAPTSTVFSLGSGTGTNPASTMIAYCFHSVEGFSKVGSYTGNGSADGTFVYTGFRPAWVMVKRTDAANNWIINDNKRGTYNVEEDWLYANLSNAETQAIFADFTSNGFKLRNNASAVNASGGTYIYLAFAENPFKYANAR